jgi:hypothetical protein
LRSEFVCLIQTGPSLVTPIYELSDMAASSPNEPGDLLITDELHHRIAHKADYQREKLAIQDLARQIDQLLPRLVHLAMELCGGRSAGISLYEAQPPGPGIFRWYHLAGRYANSRAARPHFLNEPIVELAIPFAREKRLNRLAAVNELGTVAPDARPRA